VARQVPGLERAQRLEVLELYARCQVAEGHRDEADDAYTELLGFEPSYELDEKASPKMRELFASVKHRVYPEPFLKLLPQPAGPGEALVRIVDPYHRAASLSFVHRHDGGAWESRAVSALTPVARLPLDVEPGHTLDWYLEARDEAGAALASWGSAEQPQRVVGTGDAGPVLVSGSTPRLKRAPAWVAVARRWRRRARASRLRPSRSRRRATRTTAPGAGRFFRHARAAQARAGTDAAWRPGASSARGRRGRRGVLFAW